MTSLVASIGENDYQEPAALRLAEVDKSSARFQVRLGKVWNSGSNLRPIPASQEDRAWRRSSANVNRVLPRSNPQTQEPVANLAIRYRDQAIRLSLQGYFAESESCSREALRLRPDDVDILNELGVALWRQGRSAEAEEIYHRASQIEPNDFRVLTNLGLALYSHGPARRGRCVRSAKP